MPLFTRRPRPEDSGSRGSEEDFEPLPARSREPERTLRPIELRDWEIPVAYALGGLITLLAILELTITHGPGAVKNPSPILPLIALVAGVAQIATVRFKNRFVSALVGVAGGLLVGTARVPTALGIPHSIGFLAPLVYAFLVTNRHNRAQRALRGPRTQGQRGGRRGSKAEPEPTGPKANRRYTPPKPKEDRTRRR